MVNHKFIHLTKVELSYQLQSKLLLLITILFLILSIINYHSLYQYAVNNYQLFQKTEQEMRDQGVDIEEELQKTPRISNDGNVETIENVLAYDFKNVQTSIKAFHANQVLNNTFGWLSLVFFPFIFSIYGIVVATYDYQYKTLKQKLVHSTFKSIFMSKIFSTLLFSIVNMFILTIASFIIHRIFFDKLKKNIPINEFVVENVGEDSNQLKIILFAFFVTFLFSMLGLSIGFIVKSALLPSVIIISINFLLPIQGKYDLRNLLANFGHELFTFNPNFVLFQPVSVPLFQAGAIIITFIIGLVIISYVIASKQSKYGS
ncbi:hypothetical protein [Fervidibacillus halotolerans]|uniref:ABC transporter permease n=1 Tax=Fervidibacillus halotolerans TaxID=2980027 RepID=A0A9E8RYT9_9BACI|nr:hypothetical protein [Fervidibacillus halotolerans]WAA12524.1 ABC transporter permease [Fervidibacillus halotolerans]